MLSSQKMFKLIQKQKCPYVIIFVLTLTCSALIYERENTHPCFISNNPDIKITTCFSPEMRCEKSILQQIENSQTSIYVQAYAFTSKPIVYALLDAANRGIDVKVIDG